MDDLRIKNKELGVLDEEIHNFYNIVSKYLSSTFNPHASRILKEKIDLLSKKANRMVPESYFDHLVLSNIDYLLKSHKAIHDFFSCLNSKYSLEDIVNISFGENAWNIFESKIRNYNWKAFWDYSEICDTRRGIIVRNDTEEAQNEIKRFIPKVKRDVLKFAKENGFLPKNFDFKIVQLPPSDNFSSSSWNPGLERLELSNNCFECSQQNKGIKVNPVNAYTTVFHEVLGHAAHQYFSRNMPSSLRLSSGISRILPTKIISEGIGCEKERLGIRYLEENKKRLELTDDEVLSVKFLYENLREHDIVPHILSSIIKEKQIRKKNFDAVGYVESLTGNRRLARAYCNPTSELFEEGIFKIVYCISIDTINDIKSKIKKKFGNDYFNKNQDKINKAMMTGDWTWKVYPKFIEYYLKNN